MIQVGFHLRVAAIISCVGAVALNTGSPALAQASDVSEPDGYRMTAFRAEVPKTLLGAKVIGTGEAEVLWKRKDVIFIDVLPRLSKPKNLPEGTVWRDRKRQNIPGSYWLPNVGFGRLPTSVDGYFKRHLSRLTGSDFAKPVLFYCLDKCWMSWNAAKRALEYGYSNVLWYPQGTDGWSARSLPLEERLPEE